MENNWRKLKTLLEKIIPESRRPDVILHAENTLAWLLKLEPIATQEMQLAAFAHDIDRCWFEKMLEVDNEGYIDYKRRHSQRGADIVSAMMMALEFPLESTKRVHYLISNHEFGGDEEADLIRDADSLSYFENNLPGYFERGGKEATQIKIKFMYDRASDKAKALVKSIDFEPRFKAHMNETLELDI